MKKRFTLMMMVLCFLMSIPLEMMAKTVTISYIDDESWGEIWAYVYSDGGQIGPDWGGTPFKTITTNADGKYYTLSGQQVEKPTAGGIYIHNGRKFVVK